MEMKYFDLIKPGTTHDFVKYRRVAVVASMPLSWLSAAAASPSTIIWMSRTGP